MKKIKGFNYNKTDYMYIRKYEDGKWNDGVLTEDDNITISAMSTSLHYGQQAFEGLKAYKNDKDEINLFRVEDNAKRFRKSCERLLMPAIPEEEFIEAVKEVVLANQKYIPQSKTQALYIRPFMIGVGPKLGVGPSENYLFMILVSPVGAYFTEIKPIDVLVTDYDRAAPNGTGDVKVGGNYASSLYALNKAKSQGYNDTLFLDPKTHKYIEEVGAANFFGITHDNKYVTPTSNSILASITNDSLKKVAKEYLGLEVVVGNILISEVDQFVEVGACGTAALITPIGTITHGDKVIKYNKHDVSIKLKETLLSIQYGEIEDKFNWVTKIN